ncbi:cytochrome P450 [Parathielavia appendiculata]|uniref:Cytochrome P450 n=1 Tax=Parathielavia appendiculata TaxID=2587402 RepID=A0AAN6TZI6_9PEZI|nr:cytochrome P450 [Parathielavia appendiculata]
MNELVLQPILKLGVDLGFSCALAGVAGLLSHHLYFIRGFHVLNATKITCIHLFAFALLLARAAAENGFLPGARSAVAIFSSYLAVLFLSIAIYRVAFHPLRRFPGPFPAKVTKLYGPWLARNKRIGDEFRVLHQKHGHFVRVGPNEISISHADALKQIHGLQTACSKKNNASYEAIQFRGEHNLDSLTDHAEHRQRRKVWDKALSKATALTYEAETRIVVKSWLDQLERLHGASVDTSLYAKHIACDNMGRIGYSRDFRNIQGDGDSRMFDMIEITFRTMSKLGQLIWPLVLLFSLPRFGLQKKFEELSVALVDERLKRHNDSEDLHDIMRLFIEDFLSSKPQAFWNRNILYADAQAIMVASTETIACSLSFSFFFVARDAALQRQLREAIAPAYGRTLPGEFTMADLQGIEFLDAVINETLRLCAPVPLNGPRSTPPQGIEIGGTYIPGNVHIYTPPHVYHRNPEYFQYPDEFIVERWLTRPELILDKRAFLPFSLAGRYDCVGKSVALNVLRLTLAYTVWHYDFELAPGQSDSAFMNGYVDQIVVKPAPLKCIFTKWSRPGERGQGSAVEAGKEYPGAVQDDDLPELRQRFGRAQSTR